MSSYKEVMGGVGEIEKAYNAFLDAVAKEFRVRRQDAEVLIGEKLDIRVTYDLLRAFNEEEEYQKAKNREIVDRINRRHGEGNKLRK